MALLALLIALTGLAAAESAREARKEVPSKRGMRKASGRWTAAPFYLSPWQQAWWRWWPSWQSQCGESAVSFSPSPRRARRPQPLLLVPVPPLPPARVPVLALPPALSPPPPPPPPWPAACPASSAACSASAASASALARASSFADVRALGIVLSGRLAGRLGRGGVTLGRRLRRCHRPWAGGQRDGSHRGLALVVSTSSGEGREMMGLGRGGGWNRRARRLGLAALAVLWQRRHSRWRHARLALSILRRESTRWCS